jgi:NAD(P)-dependent dehydrogenase (short-subunit alcohol dehydrogenase family)
LAATSLDEFEGRTALVTGAAQGIGRAVCQRLAGGGARVAVNYRTRKAEALATVDTIREIDGVAIAAAADVTVPEDVAAMRNSVEGELGPIDFLVNNGGWSAQSRRLGYRVGFMGSCAARKSAHDVRSDVGHQGFNARPWLRPHRQYGFHRCIANSGSRRGLWRSQGWRRSANARLGATLGRPEHQGEFVSRRALSIPRPMPIWMLRCLPAFTKKHLSRAAANRARPRQPSHSFCLRHRAS